MELLRPPRVMIHNREFNQHGRLEPSHLLRGKLPSAIHLLEYRFNLLFGVIFGIETAQAMVRQPAT